MSKSAHNYVGVSEPANEMFGKLMSISDDLMDRYYSLLLGQTRDAAIHPMEAKKLLATKITTRYHDEALGEAARNDWETRFSKKDLAAADLPDFKLSSLPTESNLLQVCSTIYEIAFQQKKSNGELKKQFISTGAVQLNGEKLTDPQALFTASPGDIFRMSKKHSVKFK